MTSATYLLGADAVKDKLKLCYELKADMFRALALIVAKRLAHASKCQLCKLTVTINYIKKQLRLQDNLL